MQALDRLKLELSNQKYFTDEEYTQFLIENDLHSTEEYDKAAMQKNLFNTVVDILEAVANDIDIMRTISTEFSTIGEAYQYVEQRIQQMKDKIASIPEPEEEYSAFSLIFTRGGSKTYGGYVDSISKDTIDKLS